MYVLPSQHRETAINKIDVYSEMLCKFIKEIECGQYILPQTWNGNKLLIIPVHVCMKRFDFAPECLLISKESKTNFRLLHLLIMG